MATPRTNGFVERFNRTVLDQFFRTTFRKQLFESVSALQKALDKWLNHYNHERPHRGYRNQERRSTETFEPGNVRRLELEKEAAKSSLSREDELSGRHLTFTPDAYCSIQGLTPSRHQAALPGEFALGLDLRLTMAGS